VVHPLNTGDIWDSGAPEARAGPMTSPPTPDERMGVAIPVGGGALDRGLDFLTNPRTGGP